ncbi:hypothetical protein K438DRAFT_1983883 [Mycena galopus ATCC 62051]|nr:hypothetical protein K438DRAFT_1983883 [Mycena galopus ATCC 62051]
MVFRDPEAIKGSDVLADDVLDTNHVDESYGTSLMEEIESSGTLLQRRPERTPRAAGGESGIATNIPDSATITGTMRALSWDTCTFGEKDQGPHPRRYIVYGNEAFIQYGNAALFMQVPAVGEGVCARMESTPICRPCGSDLTMKPRANEFMEWSIKFHGISMYPLES